jgi:hypothetical protein
MLLIKITGKPSYFKMLLNNRNVLYTVQLITIWSILTLDLLTGPQPEKKFPAFYV